MVLLEDHIGGLVVCLEVTADIRHDEASLKTGRELQLL